jgi:hypothetical protein
MAATATSRRRKAKSNLFGFGGSKSKSKAKGKAKGSGKTARPTVTFSSRYLQQAYDDGYRGQGGMRDTGGFEDWYRRLPQSERDTHHSSLVNKLRSAYEKGVRDEHREYVKKTGPEKVEAGGSVRFKGYKIDRVGDEYIIPAIDKESRFESLAEAKRFVASNPNSNSPVYIDAAYGSLFQKRGKKWYIRPSFRHPGFKPGKGPDGNKFGDWQRLHETLGPERALSSGRLTPYQGNPGPIESTVSGITQTGKSVGRYLDRQLGRVGSKLAGKHNPDIHSMTAGQINKALDKLDVQSSKLTREMIDAGRGNERPSETFKLDDPLARRMKELHRKQTELRIEVERRAGPGMSRLPKGFGPLRRNPSYTLTKHAKERAKRDGKLLVQVSSHSQAGRLKKMVSGVKWYGPVSLGSKSNLYFVDDTPENRAVLASGRVGKPMKSNPESTANDLYAKFHGKPSTSTIVIEKDFHYHENVGGLAVCCGLIVDSPTVGRIVIGLSGYEWKGHIPRDYKWNDKRDGGFVKADQSTEDCMLTSTENGKQLFLDGGDQELDLSVFQATGEEKDKESYIVGDVVCIAYETEKDFDKFQPTQYIHSFSEDSGGTMPQLRYDIRNQQLYLDGGVYFISLPVLETSPGIED